MRRELTGIAAAFVLMAGVSQAEATSIAVMDGLFDVVNGSEPGHLGLSGLGHTSTLFADTRDGWVSALTSGSDILVIERSAEDEALISRVSRFMELGGGRVIMLGGSGSGSVDKGNVFFNRLWDESTSFEKAATLGPTPIAKQAAASLTTFADDPTSLLALSSVFTVESGLPVSAEVFYGGPGNEAIFRMPFGLGDFFYLGWDFDGHISGGIPSVNDWYRVLDSAIAFDGYASGSGPPSGGGSGVGAGGGTGGPGAGGDPGGPASGGGSDPQSIPEPSTLATFGASLAALGWLRRRRRQGQAPDA